MGTYAEEGWELLLDLVVWLLQCRKEKETIYHGFVQETYKANMKTDHMHIKKVFNS